MPLNRAILIPSASECIRALSVPTRLSHRELGVSRAFPMRAACSAASIDRGVRRGGAQRLPLGASSRVLGVIS
jgi:hypothetical protein